MMYSATTDFLPPVRDIRKPRTEKSKDFHDHFYNLSSKRQAIEKTD